MEEWQIQHIKKHLVELSKVTIWNPQLIARFKASDILHNADIESLQRATPFEKSMRLYEILNTRVGAYENLLEALTEMRQTGALKILQNHKTNLRTLKSISYDRNHVLGTGSFGTKVFQGIFAERVVAVKVINSNIIDPMVAKLEVEVLKKIDYHENIIRYFNSEFDEDLFFIALELCVISLQDEIKMNLIKMDSIDILKNCTKGLVHLHKNKIIHRDMKPANILFTANKQVKISDFGVSKQIPDGMTSVTVHSGVVGTANWMAPELACLVATNETGTSFRMSRSADIFSLGCIYVFTLTNGSHPFGDVATSRQHNIQNNIHQLKTLKMQKEWLQLVEKMISPLPSNRPSCEEVLKSVCFRLREGQTNQTSLMISSDVASTSRSSQPTMGSLPHGSSSEGIISKETQTEQLDKMIAEGLLMLQKNVDALLANIKFMDENELNDFLKSNQVQVLHHLEEQIGDICVDMKTAKLQKDKFHHQTENILAAYRKKNSSGRTAALAETEKLIAECVEYYDNQMGIMQEQVTTEEDLKQPHERIQKQAIRKFKKHFGIKSDSMIRECIEKLQCRIKEIYQTIERNFVMKLKVEEERLMTTLLKVTSLYRENMDKEFNDNKDRPFSERELTAKHTQHQADALSAINGDMLLNQPQRSKLEERLNKLYQKYKEKHDLIMKSYSSDIAIGIDLGTTYCCVAIYHMGTVKILRNYKGGNGNGNTTPSYVTINPDGTTLVGKPAKYKAYANPEATIFDIKRIIGRRLSDTKLQEYMRVWPFSVEDMGGMPRIKVYGQHYLPQQISSFILKELKKVAEKWLNFEIRKAVITVPAYFTDGQRQATIEAGELAGFTILGLVNEPTAAAMAYGLLEWCNPGTSRNILVYDMRDRTFDVTVLRVSDDGNLDVLSSNGDTHFGGEDFTYKIMEFCATEFLKQTGRDLFEGKNSPIKPMRDSAKRILSRLQFHCEETKKALGEIRHNAKTTISIGALVDTVDLDVDISPIKFDQLCMTLFKKTIAIVDETIKSAGALIEEIDDVVMASGSTRIPTLQEMLQDYFNGKTIHSSIDPDETVAYGAALQAAILNLKTGR